MYRFPTFSASILLLGACGLAQGETVMERDARLAIERERYAPNAHNPGFKAIEGPGTRWAREMEESARQREAAQNAAANSNVLTETDRLRMMREEREMQEMNDVFRSAGSAAARLKEQEARNLEVGRFRHLNVNLTHLIPGMPVRMPVLFDLSGDDLAQMAAYYEVGDVVINEDPVIQKAKDHVAARHLRALHYRQLAASMLHEDSLAHLVWIEAKRLAELPAAASTNASPAAQADRRQLIGLVECWLAATGLSASQGRVAKLKPGATPADLWAWRIFQLDATLGKFTRAIAEDLDDGAVCSAATSRLLLEAPSGDGGLLSPVAMARFFTRVNDEKSWRETRLDDEYAETIANKSNHLGPVPEWFMIRKIAYAYERDAMGNADAELAKMPPGPDREATRLARAIRWYGVAADGGDPVSSLLISQLTINLRYPPDQRVNLGRWLVARTSGLAAAESLVQDLQARITRNEVPAQVAAFLLHKTAKMQVPGEFRSVLQGVASMPIPEQLERSLVTAHPDVIGYPYVMMMKELGENITAPNTDTGNLFSVVLKTPGPHQARAIYEKYSQRNYDNDREEQLAKAAALGHSILTPDVPRKAARLARIAAEKAAEKARVDAEKARVDAEVAAKAARIAAEKAEQSRLQAELVAFGKEASSLVFDLADRGPSGRTTASSELLPGVIEVITKYRRGHSVLGTMSRALASVGNPWSFTKADPRAMVEMPPDWLAPAAVHRFVERVFLDGTARAPDWTEAEYKARLKAVESWIFPWLEKQETSTAPVEDSINDGGVPPAIAAKILHGRLLARFSTWDQGKMASIFQDWYKAHHEALEAAGYATNNRDEDGAPARPEPTAGGRSPTVAMPLREALALGRIRAAVPTALQTLGGAVADRWDSALAGHADAMATLARAIRVGENESISAFLERLGPYGNLSSIGASDHLYHLRTSNPVTVGAADLATALVEHAEDRYVGLHGDPTLGQNLLPLRISARIVAALIATDQEAVAAAEHLAAAARAIDQAVGVKPTDLAWHRTRLGHVLAKKGDLNGAAEQFIKADNIDGLAQVALVLPSTTPAEQAKRDALLEQVSALAAKWLPDNSDQFCRSATFYALAQRAEAAAKNNPSQEAWAKVAALYDEGTSLTWQLEWYNSRCASRALELMAQGSLPMPPLDRMWWLRFYLEIPRTGNYVPPSVDWGVLAITAYEELALLPPEKNVQAARMEGVAMLNDAGPDHAAASAALARWRLAQDPFALAILPRAQLEKTAAGSGKAAAAAALALALKQLYSHRTGGDELDNSLPETTAAITAWLKQAKAAGLRDEAEVRKELLPE